MFAPSAVVRCIRANGASTNGSGWAMTRMATIGGNAVNAEKPTNKDRLNRPPSVAI
jgi:hypothetical protein